MTADNSKTAVHTHSSSVSDASQPLAVAEGASSKPWVFADMDDSSFPRKGCTVLQIRVSTKNGEKTQTWMDLMYAAHKTEKTEATHSLNATQTTR